MVVPLASTNNTVIAAMAARGMDEDDNDNNLCQRCMQMQDCNYSRGILISKKAVNPIYSGDCI